MADRNKTVYSFLLFSLLCSLSGCGTTQQSRFQMSFLPAAPHHALPAIEFVEPPAVPANPYLAGAAPAISVHPQLPALPSPADALIQKAEMRFRQGRKFYQAQDYEHARREFDATIDTMLRASASGPSDRPAFEHRFDQMVDAIHRYDLSGLGSGAGVEEVQFDKAPLEDILQMTFPVDPKLKTRVKEQVQATASQLPLSQNDAVLGYIHYFSGRGHKTLVAGLERLGRYKPLIQRILDEEGLPQELIHLAQAESGFMPRAISRARAGGMWQFLNWRGQQYGLTQTRYTDERFDPEQATRAAARHLRDLYNEFGDWYLAIAAYNCGPGVVEKAVERTGYADFWELRSRRVLPLETTNYVPIIVAMTIMVKNAAAYDLDHVVPDPPLEYDTVEMSAPTNLALLADLSDAPVSELITLNPSLLKGIAPEGYALRVPKGTASTLMASLQMIPAERRGSWRMHKVESGETLAAIGKRYGAAPGVIAAANNLADRNLVAGDRLVIPAVYKETPVARRVVSRRTSDRRVVHRKPRRKGPAVLARTASSHRPSAAAKN